MYELRTTDAFDLQVAVWAGCMEQWDDIWFNFDYQLINNASLGHEIPGTYLRALALETNPPLTVYYHINERDRTITLLHIGEV